MKRGMTVPELIDEVKRQAAAKRDLLANTRDQLRLVPMEEFPHKVALVTLANDGTRGPEALLERFEITDNCHAQIADFLSIPWRYYYRLLDDHLDLVLTQVNTLFEREPGMRMVRTLDGKARAFVSDRYRRIDNDMVLAQTLPALYDAEGNLPQSRVIGSHLSDDSMRIRVVWTDPSLEQTIGTVDGKADIVKPGFELFNSETGRGSLNLRGFFHRGYCDNGCIWQFGDQDLSYRRYHLGGKLKAEGFEIFSDDTKRKDDEALVAQLTDILKALGSREFVQKMGDSLRALKSGEQVQVPSKAIEVLGKSVGLYEAELDAIMTNFIAGRDMSRWGALNAITAHANNPTVGEERSFELQEIGSQLITMNVSRWSAIANAGVVAAAA